MDITKALSERFEDAEFVEIRHVFESISGSVVRR
jgi:hypothetical protein